MYESFACVYASVLCMCLGSAEVRREALGTLELELWVVLSYHTGAREQTSKCFWPLTHLSSPRRGIISIGPGSPPSEQKLKARRWADNLTFQSKYCFVFVFPY